MERIARIVLCSLIALVLGFRIGLSLVDGGPIDVGRVGVGLLAVVGLGLVIQAVSAGFRVRAARREAMWPRLRTGADQAITARWVCVRTLFGGTRYPALHRPAFPLPLVASHAPAFPIDVASSASASSSVAAPEAATRVRWVAPYAA